MNDEVELIERCKEGCNAARKKLYEIYSHQMLGICLRYTGDRMTAQDLLHDGFIKVFTSVSSFQYRGNGSFKAWISKLFTNLSLEFLRKQDITRELSLDDCQELESSPEEKDYEIISDDVLMKFITELPVGYRMVFNMYTFEEMSHKEIGEALGINESSSRSQLSRAKAILANKIKEYIKLHG